MSSFSNDDAHLAAAYDRLSDSQFDGGKSLVGRLSLKKGECVLDAGCGTGRLADWIAETVGADAVVGIDPLPERIALARDRNPHIRFEVGQAEDLSVFGSAQFDAVCMSAVFHWIGDRRKALTETARVLRVGGRLGITTIPKELHRAGTMAAVSGPVFGRSPYRERLNMEALPHKNDPTTTEIISLVLECGFELVELHVVQRTRKHENATDVIDFVESSSFGNFLRLMPDELREPLRDDLIAAFAPLKGPDGIVLKDYGMLLVARRSGR